jgi:hypothetical protein
MGGRGAACAACGRLRQRLLLRGRRRGPARRGTPRAAPASRAAGSGAGRPHLLPRVCLHWGEKSEEKEVEKQQRQGVAGGGAVQPPRPATPQPSGGLQHGGTASSMSLTVHRRHYPLPLLPASPAAPMPPAAAGQAGHPAAAQLGRNHDAGPGTAAALLKGWRPVGVAWMWETRHCQSLRAYAPLSQAATVML